MKKNGNIQGRFMRFLAIFCAAVLTVQAIPAGSAVSLAVQASESGKTEVESTRMFDTPKR